MNEKRLFQFQVLKDSWVLTRDYPVLEKESGTDTETEIPKLDLYETDEDIIAEVDLPGIEPQDQWGAEGGAQPGPCVKHERENYPVFGQGEQHGQKADGTDRQPVHVDDES